MGKPKKPSTKPATGLRNNHDAKNPSRRSVKPDRNISKIVMPAKMTTYTLPPPNWLSSMPYLSIACASPTLSSSQQLTTQPSALPSSTSEVYSIPSLAAFSPASNPLVQIRPIVDPAHPAYPQFGLFASKTLPPGTHMLDYTGLIHSCPQPECATSDYDLAFLDRDTSIAIDGANMGNEGRFVNDYHGIRPQGPNAMFEEYYVRVKNIKGKGEIWQARMGIWVAPIGTQQESLRSSYKGISKGEEICVSYGKGWWRARRGLMEEQSEELDQTPENEENNPEKNQG